MATNKKTVSVYADDDLLTALEAFKDSGNHKSLNVAIVAILREKLFGEVSGNVQSNVSSTLDVESMINEAIANLKASINDELVDIKQAIAAIETNRSEATETTKKPLTLSPQMKVIAMQKLQATA